jgi:hypothetical protein
LLPLSIRYPVLAPAIHLIHPRLRTRVEESGVVVAWATDEGVFEFRVVSVEDIVALASPQHISVEAGPIPIVEGPIPVVEAISVGPIKLLRNFFSRYGTNVLQRSSA